MIDQRNDWNNSKDKTAAFDQYYRELGNIYFLKKNYSSALKAYHQKIVVDTIEYGERGLRVWVDYGKIGIVHICQGDSIGALGYFIKSLEALESDKFSNIDVSDYKTKIGNCQIKQDTLKGVNRYMEALEHIHIQSKIRHDIINLFDSEKILEMIKTTYQQNE